MAKSNTAKGSKAAPAKKSSKAAPAKKSSKAAPAAEAAAEKAAAEKAAAEKAAAEKAAAEKAAAEKAAAEKARAEKPEAPRRAVWGRDGRTAIVYKGNSKHSVYTLEPVAPPTGEQERTGYLWMAATNHGEQQTPAALVKGEPIGEFQAEAFEAVDALWEEQQVEVHLFEGREE
jgi:hypothetical protein